jgi:hypothetical protein
MFGTYMSKTAPEKPPIPLNSLFHEDSTDSDEDLAEELDEFFRFMIRNDLSGEEEEAKSSFIEDEELEGSISATDFFAEFDGFDTITDDDSAYLPQASDNRVRFLPSAQGAKYSF